MKTFLKILSEWTYVLSTMMMAQWVYHVTEKALLRPTWECVAFATVSYFVMWYAVLHDHEKKP